MATQDTSPMIDSAVDLLFTLGVDAVVARHVIMIAYNLGAIDMLKNYGPITKKDTNEDQRAEH